MTAGTTGARRTLAVLAVGLLVAAVALLTGPTAASAQDCTLLPLDPDCHPSTTVEEPTSETTSTSEARSTTTTARTTATTAPRTSTTTAAPVTTTTTVETITTVTNLLVPGDGTDGAESTTTSEVSPTATVSDDGPSDGTLIALVIAGLLVIALVVSLLTWRYWVATRPPLLEDPGPRPGGSTRPARAAPAR